MTKESIFHDLDSIRARIEDVLKESPQLLSEPVKLEDVRHYAGAMSSLSFALAAIDYAKDHLKGGDGNARK